MSAAEFREWMIYYNYEPFGPHILNRLVSQVVSTICNLFAGPGQRVNSHDIYPVPWRTQPQAAPDQMILAILNTFPGNWENEPK